MSTQIHFPKATEMAHELVAQRVKKRHTVIDATAGNGRDTLFLAEAVGNGGTVYAFDIQPDAIDATRARMEASVFAKPVQYFCQCHSEMDEVIPPTRRRHVKAIMFNLGYLPGGEKSETTTWPTTLKAIRISLGLMADDGIVTIAVYPGHPAGKQESVALEKFVTQLAPDEFRVVRYSFMNSLRESPYLLAIEKNHK